MKHSGVKLSQGCKAQILQSLFPSTDMLKPSVVCAMCCMCTLCYQVSEKWMDCKGHFQTQKAPCAPLLRMLLFYAIECLAASFLIGWHASILCRHVCAFIVHGCQTRGMMPHRNTQQDVPENFVCHIIFRSSRINVFEGCGMIARQPKDNYSRGRRQVQESGMKLFDDFED